MCIRDRRRSGHVPAAVRPPTRRVPPRPSMRSCRVRRISGGDDVDDEVRGLSFVRSSPRRTAFSRGGVGPRRDDQDMAALISRALDLPPGPRRESFVWAHAWRRGFSLTADLSGWPDQCAWLLGEHRRRPVVIVGAVQDAGGLWHLVGSSRCCTTSRTTVHRRRVVATARDHPPTAQLNAGRSRCRCRRGR